MNKYLDKLVNIFNLQHWEIDVVIENVIDDNCGGVTYFIENDYKCTISIKKDSEEEMLETLIHELIHIIKRNSQYIAIDNLRENKPIYDVWYREMEKEQQVLAKGIYKLLKGENNE